jgi:Alpha/beta hydrolase domain
LNQDEAGRTVFDGVIPHIAGARRGEFNLRFGQPSANTLQGPNNVFPFSDHDQTDPVTGQTDGLLSRIAREGALPKIVYLNSSAEYWRGDASLGHIGVDGREDVTLPDHVRNYLMAGTQHTPGALPLKDTSADGGRGQHPLNSVDYSPLLRAALVNLDRWAAATKPHRRVDIHGWPMARRYRLRILHRCSTPFRWRHSPHSTSNLTGSTSGPPGRTA